MTKRTLCNILATLILSLSLFGAAARADNAFILVQSTTSTR